MGFPTLAAAGASHHGNAFSPLDLAPVGWWRADTAVFNGDGDLTAWPDQSGSGHDLAILAGAPYSAPGALGGQPGVGLESTPSGVLGADFALPQPRTVYVVYAGPSTSDTMILTGDYDGTEWVARYGDFGLDPDYLFVGDPDAGLPAGDLDTDFYLGAILDGASSAVRLNGALVASGDAGSDAGSGLRVGGGMDAGIVCEVIAFDRALSGDDLAALEGYFAARYGL